MNKYYKSEDVIDKVTEYISSGYPTEERAREDVELLFADLPTIEVMEYPQVEANRPQGEWIADDNGYKKCSNCGEYAPLNFDDYYMRGGKIRQEEELLLCPYCEARMFAKDTNVPNKKGADDE